MSLGTLSNGESGSSCRTKINAAIAAVNGLRSDPLIAYIRSDGVNGTAAVGNPSLPYLTAQAAYTAGAKYFDIGAECDAGIVVTTQNEELFVRGRGKTSKIAINTHGYNVVVWDTAGISTWIYVDATPVAGGNGGNVTIHYGYVAYVSSIGGIGDGSSPGGTYNGYNGGNITLFGPMAVAGQVATTGGAGGTDNAEVGAIYGDGGNAGNIDIRFGVKFVDGAGPIEAKKGLKYPGGFNDGADGAIALRGCDTGSVVPDCGTNTPTYIAAIVNGVFIAS